jgi:hypothetical protein
MSSFVVYFPDGSREFRYPPKPLEEGDVVWHEGQRYRVIHIATENGNMASVTVELDSEDMGDLLRSERGGVVLVPD